VLLVRIETIEEIEVRTFAPLTCAGRNGISGYETVIGKE
jgi:hypothetical protein